jgi:hypothetical protein
MLLSYTQWLLAGGMCLFLCLVMLLVFFLLITHQAQAAQQFGQVLRAGDEVAATHERAVLLINGRQEAGPTAKPNRPVAGADTPGLPTIRGTAAAPYLLLLLQCACLQASS